MLCHFYWKEISLRSAMSLLMQSAGLLGLFLTNSLKFCLSGHDRALPSIKHLSLYLSPSVLSQLWFLPHHEGALPLISARQGFGRLSETRICFTLLGATHTHRCIAVDSSAKQWKNLPTGLNDGLPVTMELCLR